MAEKHPYLVTQGNLTSAVTKLRSKFQDELSVEVLKKLSLAPGNEGSVLAILTFLGVYDGEGKATTKGSDVFHQHKPEDFQTEFAKLIEVAYSELFKLHGDDAWAMSSEDLTAYFKKSDKTPTSTSKRQALAFTTAAGIGGKRTLSATPVKAAKDTSSTPKAKSTVTKPAEVKTSKTAADHKAGVTPFAPSVHIDVQVHISADSTNEQIEQIFASMRKHLFDGS